MWKKKRVKEWGGEIRWKKEGGGREGEKGGKTRRQRNIEGRYDKWKRQRKVIQ